ncbi:MAG: tail fiber protein [Salinivirgaceae bacterium]|nr:tail fiber protein [Salinivirgaceae bacterium]
MEGTIGEVKIFAGNFAPRNWAYCEGQLMPISQYTTLYSLINTYYGGDGVTNFKLPDLRGRVPVGVGGGPGMTPIALGQMWGQQYHTLSIHEMPQHTHTAQATASGASVGGTATAVMNVNTEECEERSPDNRVLGPSSSSDMYQDTATDGKTLKSDAITVDTSGLTVDVSGLSVAVNPAGGSQTFSIMQPYVGMHWIICLDGTYPQRN